MTESIIIDCALDDPSIVYDLGLEVSSIRKPGSILESESEESESNEDSDDEPLIAKKKPPSVSYTKPASRLFLLKLQTLVYYNDVTTKKI